MEVSSINSANAPSTVNLYTIYKVLSSTHITNQEKTNFIRKNNGVIRQYMDVELTGFDYRSLMTSRPLEKFKPLKNSFTKKGDKILLAKMLGIDVLEVDEYIESIEQKSFDDKDKLKQMPIDKLDAIKTYVYRHGSKSSVVKFLDYELRRSTDILNTLYKTLNYNTGGLADYFVRPIHRMSNNTLVKLYDVISQNLDSSCKSGKIQESEKDEMAKWALVQIYKIQNNSKFINAVKTYKELK